MWLDLQPRHYVRISLVIYLYPFKMIKSLMYLWNNTEFYEINRVYLYHLNFCIEWEKKIDFPE